MLVPRHLCFRWLFLGADTLSCVYWMCVLVLWFLLAFLVFRSVQWLWVSFYETYLRSYNMWPLRAPRRMYFLVVWATTYEIWIGYKHWGLRRSTVGNRAGCTTRICLVLWEWKWRGSKCHSRWSVCYRAEDETRDSYLERWKWIFLTGFPGQHELWGSRKHLTAETKEWFGEDDHRKIPSLKNFKDYFSACAVRYYWLATTINLLKNLFHIYVLLREWETIFPREEPFSWLLIPRGQYWSHIHTSNMGAFRTAMGSVMNWRQCKESSTWERLEAGIK